MYQTLASDINIPSAKQLISKFVCSGDTVYSDFNVERKCCMVPLDLQFVHLILPSAYATAPSK
jgi:hypothetical protein